MQPERLNIPRTCRATRLVAPLVLATLALGAALSAPASAWPGNEKDLCAGASRPSEVTTTNPITSQNPRGEQGVWTIRACSPDLRLTRLGVASPTEMFRHVEPQRVMQGGAGAPSISRGRLTLFPYMMGPEGEAVRFEGMLGSDVVKEALIGAGIGFTSTVAIGVATCLLGGAPSGGIACAAIPIAAVAGILSAIGGVLQALIGNHLERVVAMGSSAWDFHPPEGWKGWIIWNGFGTIGHQYIDPSFSNTWAGSDETPPFRMWAWFSAFAFTQGRNPDSGKSSDAHGSQDSPPLGAEDVDPADLRTTAGEITVGGPNEIIDATPDRHRITGGAGDDVFLGTTGNDRLSGRPGEDVLAGDRGNDRLIGGPAADDLFGGPGRDRLSGGAADDQLIGGPGGDTLIGGPGSDTLFDTSGPTIVRGGSGNDKINVMDGRADDRVDCGSGSRDVVFYDPGDRVSLSCEFAFPDGKGAPGSPTGLRHMKPTAR
jgi:hypothetical protein